MNHTPVGCFFIRFAIFGVELLVSLTHTEVLSGKKLHTGHSE